jgi:uncharacterized protein (TIGR02588 family)
VNGAGTLGRGRAPTAERDGRDGRPEEGAGARGEARGRSFAEHVSFAVSALIVAGVVVLVTYLHFTRENTPADVAVRFDVGAVRRTETGYAVPVEIANTGGETGVDVRVVAALTGADGRETSAEVTVPFLAGGSRHRGVLVFPADPAAGTLAVESVSYTEP